jgi:tetratricopeptide (TPR) repeat protein
VRPQPSEESRRANRRLTLGRPKEALRAAERRLAEHPEDWGAWMVKGEAHRSLKEWHEAIAAARRVLQLAPEEEIAHFTLGWSLLKLGRPAEAVQAANQALRIQPDFLDAHRLAGLAAADLYRRDPRVHQARGDALRAVEEMLRLDPQGAGTLICTGAVHGALGNEQGAVAAWQDALALEPDNTEAMRQLGLLHGRRGRTLQALPLFQSVLALAPHTHDIPPQIVDLYTREARKVAVPTVPFCAATVVLAVVDALGQSWIWPIHLAVTLLYVAVLARQVRALVRMPEATRRFLRGLQGFAVWSASVLLLPMALLLALVIPAPLSFLSLLGVGALALSARLARKRVAADLDRRYRTATSID